VNSELTITAYVTVALLEAGLQVQVMYIHSYGIVSHLVATANKLSTSSLRTACPKLSTSLEQTVNNL
jgi:hypothetical protein